jgi:outer membrane protein OmpA-like peptidoglycan-associated protein
LWVFCAHNPSVKDLKDKIKPLKNCAKYWYAGRSLINGVYYMMTRFGLYMVLVSMLSFSLGACSAVPDRYAPWRDNDAAPTAGKTPNLGDVPAAPNVADAKAQMDSMRTRLQNDRDSAYQAQGVTPPIDNNSGNTYTSPVVDSDLAPPSSSAAASAPVSNDISATNLPEPQPVMQQTAQNNAGNVYYNYDSSIGNNYTYGYDAPVSAGSIETSAPEAMASSNDPSIAIDMSVLGGNGGGSSNTNPTIFRGGLTTGDPIAYFAHGSAKLGPKDRASIRQLASKLKSAPQTVMLAGNASKRTGISNSELSREINLKMSERRADAVMDELVKLGVSPEQIYLSAYGDSMPKGSEAADRRVEVIFDQ